MMNYSIDKDTRSKKLAFQTPINEADEEEAEEIIGRRMTSVANNSVYVRPEIAHFEDLFSAKLPAHCCQTPPPDNRPPHTHPHLPMRQ
jgi:hypothetical protein